MPEISIIHPSRSRPKYAATTALNWLRRADNGENIEYILSVDSDDPLLDAYIYEFNRIGDIQIVINENKSCIEAMNAGAKVSTGNLIIGVSDDFSCNQNWDSLLLTALKGKSDYCVKTQDGQQPWIITLPIMDRTYYDRFCYIYPPHIKHMFADTWMTHVADLLDRKITLGIMFSHDHYTTGKVEADALNVRNNATWAQGEAAYLEGVRTNFGLINPPGQLRCPESHMQWFRNKGIDVNRLK